MGNVPIEGTYWQHFKGTLYEIVGIARCSETQKPLVLYREEHRDILWARPLSMWYEEIDRDGYKGPRFVRHDT